MASLKELLSLFFSFAKCESNKGMYARQTIQLKKLVLQYGIEDLERVLNYISAHKEDYNISSLAYIPYIFDSVLALTWATNVKEEIEFKDLESVTANVSKSKKFGKKEEEWGDMFAFDKGKSL